VPKSLRKQPKVFLWDWSLVVDEGARRENLIASHLLKAIHGWTDIGLSMVAIVDGGLVAVNDGRGQPQASRLGDQSPSPPGILSGMEGTTSWREEESGRPGLLTSPRTP
jgi:hypothetical protein